MHSSAEAGVAVISAGAATNVVNPRSKEVKRAILRINHLPIWSITIVQGRAPHCNIALTCKFVTYQQEISDFSQSIRRKWVQNMLVGLS